MPKRIPRLPTDLARAIAAVFTLFASALTAAAAPAVREAPNPGAVPFDQLAVAGNACGPAALLNSFRFGDKNWQQAVAIAAGDTDKARLLSVIRTWGLRPSNSLAGRKRWSRHGINADDLRDMANEMAHVRFLPQLKCEVLMTTPGESPQELLRRTHSRLSTSLAKGLPPVISIRRIVHRKVPGKAPEWIVLQGHFVTVTRLPAKLERDATGFDLSYIDPWGGRSATGRLALSNNAFVVAPGTPSPCLEAAFPQADVGKKQARAGEATLLTLAAGIGKW